MNSKAKVNNYVDKHNICYSRPAQDINDCLLIGNGDIGMNIDFTGMQSHFGYIMKSDVWRPKITEDTLKSLYKIEDLIKACSDPELMKRIIKEEQNRFRKEDERHNDKEEQEFYNTVMPMVEQGYIGTLALCKASLDLVHNEKKVEIDANKLIDFNQVLSLEKAEVNTDFKYDIFNIKRRTLVHSERNLIWLKLSDTASSGFKYNFCLMKNKFPCFDTVPTFGYKSNIIWLSYKFEDGSEYAIAAGLREDIKVNLKSLSNGQVLEWESNNKEVNLFIVIKTSNECSDPLNEAIDELNKIRKVDTGELFIEHRKYWDGFWSESNIRINNLDFENFWYVANYLLACSCRGSFWPTEFGPFATNEYTSSWLGLQFLNELPYQYFSVFTGNHFEFAKNFIDSVFKMLEGARLNARYEFGVDGAHIPLLTDSSGIEMAYGTTRINYTADVFICNILWIYYLYTEDIKALKDKIYPVIKEVAVFFTNILKKDNNGKYYIPAPSFSQDERVLNDFTKVKNETLSLALLYRHFESAIKSSLMLDVDTESRKKWSEILENLSELPNDGKIFLSYEGERKPLEPTLVPTFLAGLFPARTVKEDDEKVKNSFDLLFKHYICDNENPPVWRMDPFTASLGYPFLCLALTWYSYRKDYINDNWWEDKIDKNWRGGNDKVADCLENIMRNFVLPNGLTANQDETTVNRYGRNLARRPGISVPSEFAASINELFCNSLYDGLVSVFENVPDSWVAEFNNFRTVGGFYISGTYYRGYVIDIKIKSEKNKELNLKVPNSWDVNKISVKDLKTGKHVDYKISKKTITIDIISAREYLIVNEDEDKLSKYYKDYNFEVNNIGNKSLRYIGL